MKRYTLNENKGDIAYEVEDNLLTLKVRPEFVSSIPVGEGVYIIKTGDNTIPSDYNVLSAKRTMEEIEGAITGIKPAEQYWAIVKNAEDGTELEESEWFLAPKAGYSIYSPKNITAAGAIAAGYASPNIEDPGVPIAGYEAIGYSKYDPEHFVVDETGLVRIKDGAGGGTGEFKDITLITSTSTEKSSDYSVYTSLKVDNLLKNIDGKPSSLWVKDKTSEYLLLSDDGTKARLLLPFDITGTLDVSGRIATKSDVAAEGAVWAGLKSTTVASNPVAGYEAIGMCRFDSTQFTVNQGLVRITGEIGGGTTSYWGVSGTGWAYAVLDDVSKQVSLYGHSHSTLSFNYGSLNSTTNTSYNGTSQTTVYIPTAVSHLTNDNGYIYDATNTTSPIKYLSNSGDKEQYLNGGGSFATIPDTHLSHDPSNTIYVDTYSNQNIAGQKWFTGKGSVLIGPTNNVHIQPGLGSGNCIHGLTSTGAMGNLYFNYNSDSSFIKCDPNDNFVASGSIIAGATSSAYSSNNFPTAGTSAKGMCYFDSTYFTVTSAGKVSLKTDAISGGGSSVSYTAGSYTSSNGYLVGTLNIDGKSYQMYSSKVGEKGNYYKPVWSGTNLSFDLYNGATDTVIKSTEISSVNLKGNDGSGITKVQAPSSVNTDSGKGNTYTCYVGSTNVGSFTVYNGKQGAAGPSWNGGTVSGDVIVSSSTPGFRLLKTGRNRWNMWIDGSNSFVIDVTSVGARATLVEKSGNDWVIASDMRLKNYISKVNNVLEKIENIDVFRYTFKNGDNRENIGVSAQAVQTVFPEFVSVIDQKDGMDILGVSYSNLATLVSINGLKELHALVKIQREEINSLRSWRLDKEEQISSLESRIAKLEQMLNELTVK